MKKIPTIFQRDLRNRGLIFNNPTLGCEWVFNGKGLATRKYDGTCCMISRGSLYKRREVKKGKPIPDGLFVEIDHDEVTGKTVGWVDVEPEAKENRWHMEALSKWINPLMIPDGTYELVGPKVQGNPEGYEKHKLIPHRGAMPYEDAPTEFNELKEWFIGKDIEGLVFHALDGRMAKIKKKDFGLKRKD